MERIAAWFVQPPTSFTCSAQSGHGRQELLGVIDETLAAIRAHVGEDFQPVAAPKKRPDRHRPW
jgi:hypothetical protein